MKIAYVAKHGSGGNDDEGSIAFALEMLGHTVKKVLEQDVRVGDVEDSDLVLFHHPTRVDWVAELSDKNKTPAVLWYFDLIDYPQDPTLRRRCDSRVSWITEVSRYVKLGFCTDGDWVQQHPEKLRLLRQGADVRHAGKGTRRPDLNCSILFTGIYNGGTERQTFVDGMQRRFGPGFRHITKGLHGRELADQIRSSNIVVAPDGPVTDDYWSNRIYLTLGFGGFLLHPYCAGLVNEYQDGDHLVYYHDRDELITLVQYYWGRKAERDKISEQGLRQTLAFHTYTHRCVKLIDTVKEELGI